MKTIYNTISCQTIKSNILKWNKLNVLTGILNFLIKI